MANKLKETRSKREALLPHRGYSKNFVIAYGFIEQDFRVFFGISGKAAGSVIRNRIKRFFRDMVRKELGALISEGVNGRKLSICLISKKGTVIPNNEAAISDLKNEIHKLVTNIVERIGKEIR